MRDSLISSARQILKNEGLVALFSRTLLYLRRRLFVIKNYYLCEQILREWNEADYMPKIDSFDLKVVSTNIEADEIANEGFDDFRDCTYLMDLIDARLSLNKGAVAFCLFIDKKLAHVGLVAMSEEAKKTFDNLPYHVDFSHGQACSGTVTLPKYRGKGLMTYSCFKRFEFLRKEGYQTSRYAVATDNQASQKVHTKFGHRIYAKVRYIEIGR